MAHQYKIAVVPGDGIGHEIVPAGIRVLNVAAERFDFGLSTETFPYGAGYYKETGEFLPPDALDTLEKFDAIYFGGGWNRRNRRGGGNRFFAGTFANSVACWL